ncbi:hypothetical protein FQA39_LY00459 [Lamprigera yunnana]|nr:hypothetical protein FQA39_LY00459 [Lamprigera yunnana]
MMNSENVNESSTCERQGYELSVDEIVTMTVRALMTHQQITAAPLNVERENREGRRRTQSPPSFKNNEIASLLPEFSGHDDDVRRWIQLIDAVQRTYEVPDTVMQLISIGKLTKQAKLWYHSKLPNDMENYMQYHVIGSVLQVHMKPGCIPRRFECQPDRRKQTSNTTERSYVLKKKEKNIDQR